LNVFDPEILAGVESCCFHGVSPSQSRTVDAPDQAHPRNKSWIFTAGP